VSAFFEALHLLLGCLAPLGFLGAYLWGADTAYTTGGTTSPPPKLPGELNSSRPA
jgi:hypothetical protein